jgi:hypothetical protein
MVAQSMQQQGELMDIEKIIAELSKELNSALKAMSKAKNVNEKELYSRIIKNITDSLAVFCDIQDEMIAFEDEDLPEEDLPF